MSNPNTAIAPGTANGQASLSVTRDSANLGFRFQTADALPLPPDFSNYGFNKLRITFSAKDIVFIPAVDTIINEYAVQRLQIIFTIKFVELINQQFFLFDYSSGNDKLEYAVNFYFKICNLPMVSSADVRKTLAFYLDAPSALGLSVIRKGVNSAQLAQALLPLEMKYFEQLKQVVYVHLKNSVKLGDTDAKWFIDFANGAIEKDLTVYFANIKARLIQHLPDAVVNDPRFRASLEDRRWDDYDETIKSEVAYYNGKFSSAAGYKSLDWRIVKAMLWTELLAGPGGNQAQWDKYPLQIGRFSADAGFSVVKGGKENSDLITSDALRQQVQSDVTGKNNIKAGIAYLYTIAVKNQVERREVIDNPQVEKYVIQPADRNGLDAIAGKIGTTSDNIAANSGIKKTDIVKPGQTLQYQRAHIERYIRGWNDWLKTVNDYNGGGDANYMDKFNRAYQIISSRSAK